MRFCRIILVVLLSLPFTGCSWRDSVLSTLVGIFPDAYSGGGTSVYEKQSHLDQALNSADANAWR